MDAEIKEEFDKINSLLDDFRTEFKRSRHEIRGEFVNVRTETGADFAKVRAERSAEFAKVRAELGEEIRAEGITTRRHFDIVAESLRNDIRLIAEGLVTLDDKVEGMRR